MRLYEANWIRTYSILSIVVWHCMVCPITCWNLIGPSEFTETVNDIFFFFIPQANMPLFTCLSGYLFAHLYENKKESYTHFRGILNNKFHRLVVPFLIIGTMATAVVPERPLISGIIWGNGSSLWFCIMLFWVSLLRWCVLKINLQWVYVTLFSFSIVVYLLGVGYNQWIGFIPVGVFCFGRALHFYWFFVLGSILYKKRNAFIDIKNNQKILIIFVIYLSVGLLSLLELNYISFICIKLMPLLLILVVFFVFFKVSERTKNSIKIGRRISDFCRHCFGIYVLHEAFSWNCYHNSTLLAMFRLHPLVYSISFTIFTLVLCYYITHYCLKTKIGRYLLK